MSGFRWDRATYDSALYAGNSERWVVDGRPLQIVDHSREWNRLTLEVRLRTDAERATLSDLKDDAGSFTSRIRADGVFEARDSVGGSNTVQVTPPSRYTPPREAGEFLVADVTAARTSADGTAERATVTLVPRQSKDTATDAVLSTAFEPWSIGTVTENIRTSRIASEIRNEGDRIVLIATLTPEQVDVFESAASAVGGVVSETLPDDDTRTRDTTPVGRQTVFLSPPVASDIESGEYVVVGWRTETVTSARHQTTITLDAV